MKKEEKKQKPKSTEVNLMRLGDHLRMKMKESNLTVRAAAEKIGMSYPYLSEIMNGKRKPEVNVCNAIADAFDEPRITILRYAGWVEDDDMTATFAELERLAKKDPRFLELMTLYRKLDSEEKKKILLDMVRVALGESDL